MWVIGLNEHACYRMTWLQVYAFIYVRKAFPSHPYTYGCGNVRLFQYSMMMHKSFAI